MMKILLPLFALIAGCGAPSYVSRPIDSEPQGAKVFLDGAPCGVTPTVLRLLDEAEDISYVLRVELDGHRTHQEVIANRYHAPRESAGAAFARGMVGGAAPQGYFSWPHNFLVRLVKTPRDERGAEGADGSSLTVPRK